MTSTVGRPGRLTITRCASICEACAARVVQRCVSVAGERGYVTMCFNCMAEWYLSACIAERDEYGVRQRREPDHSG